jgi:nucleosome binding factor SPN SPT16 subunit
MVYFLSLSFKDLVSEKGFIYTIQLGDVVCVTKSQPEVITKEVSKNINEILYNMEEDDEDENGDNHNKRNDNGNGYMRTRQADRNVDSGDNTGRKDHQRSLLEKKNREFEEKLRKLNTKDDDTLVLKKNITSIKCYNSKNQLPHDIKHNKISVDSKANAILLPVFGMIVPFHVSLVKNISLSDEAGFSYLRINFNVPNHEVCIL